MMPTSLTDFERAIYHNWASHLGCPSATFEQAGTTILPIEKYTGERIVAIWHIGKHTFVELDPTYTPEVRKVLQMLPEGTALTGADLLQAWGAAAVEWHDLGLMHYLYPPDLPDFAPAAPFTLRQLTEADADAMEYLHQACTPEETDEGFVEVDHEIAFGCFHGSQLAAAASGYERTGFMDIGVLTHPGFRQKKLGKAVVGALCEWTIRKGMIAQYRCNVQNVGSHRVAKALNFRLYFKTEGISVKNVSK